MTTETEKNSDISFEELMQHSEEQKKRFRCTPDNLFGYILFLFRSELEVSQEVMGFMMGGLSKSGYSKLENGIYSVHLSHIYLLCYITNVPRKFINDLLDYLTEFCIQQKAAFYIADDIAVAAINENNEFPNAQQENYDCREKMNTPLKEYSAFFGLDHVKKISRAINIAIKNGGKLEPRVLD